MTITAPSADEMNFSVGLNARLKIDNLTGARVFVSTMTHDRREPEYLLTIQAGSRRHTIRSDDPWHYQSVDDVLTRIRDWLASARQAQRWTTNLEEADAE